MPPASKKLLMIVDGHAVLHRAWHALPPLSTKTGLVVSGAYGFTSTLLRALRELKPSHIAVTFDLKGPTFRHEEFEQYKAQREKKPDELYAQVPLIEKILAAMDIKVFTARGYEADDVIGTITERARKEDPDINVIIVTGDLDTLQLIDERTQVYTMRKGMSDIVIYDAHAVKDRFGLEPEQMVDYKALRGDPSDNIPGVKGIGEKTASELIGDFGSLDALYQAVETGGKKAGEIRPSVKDKLIEHKPEAYQARELSRIRLDAPIDFSLGKCAFVPPNREKVLPVFEEFQFLKMIQQLPVAPGAAPAPAPAAPSPAPAAPAKPAAKKIAALAQPATLPLLAPPAPASSAPAAPAASPAVKFRMINEADTLVAALQRAAASKKVGLRTLTASDDPVEPPLIALALAGGRRVAIASREAVAGARQALTDFLASPRRLKVVHDLKREINVFASLGIRLEGPFNDLMISSYLYFSGERRHSMDAILAYYRNIPPPLKGQTPDERLARLGLETSHLLSLATELDGQLRKYRLTSLSRNIELPLAPILARMERVGIGVDVPYLKKLSRDFQAKIDSLETKIHKLAGGEFNINSPQQVKTVLFDKLGLSPAGLKKTEKGHTLSTAASELEKLRGSHPIVDAILAYRELAKLKSTYVDALPGLVHAKTGRIHASFNQAVTATGRLSSSDPNLQNIPTEETEYGRQVRNAFVAAPGWTLLYADYSQIELRIAAHLAKEKVMIAAFKKGEDIHWRTAVEMFGAKEADAKRRIAKTINFGILFGMGPNRLSESAGIPLTEARAYIDRYFDVYRGIAAYERAVKEKIRKDGYVATMFGRRRFFYNFELMNHREQAEAERQAVNMPIQGTEADMIKLAMVGIDAALEKKYGSPDDAPIRLLIQVHDELVFEVKKGHEKEAAALIKPIMEKVKRLSVPVKVNLGVGERWGEMKEME